MTKTYKKLKDEKNILIDLNIIPDTIDINNAKIKEPKMMSNYKLKLILEDDKGNRGTTYIKAIDDKGDIKGMIKGRNILGIILISQKIIGMPLIILPKLYIDTNSMSLKYNIE